MKAPLRDRIKGYYVFEISNMAERFLSLCKRNHIRVKNIRNNGGGTDFQIQKQDLEACEKYLNKVHAKAAIKEKHGLPFLFAYYQKKSFFFISLIVCLILLFNSMQRIWGIEIEGNSRYSLEEISDFLNNRHIRIGMSKNSVDFKLLEKEFRSCFPDITWVSTSIHGTKLCISFRENEFPNTVIGALDTPIVAQKSGYICFVEIESGTALIKSGDYVQKGDILISNRVEIRDESREIAKMQETEAIGIVKAYVTYNYINTCEFAHEIRYYSNRHKRFGIRIGAHKIMFGKKNSNFAEISCLDRPICILGDWVLPFSFVKENSADYTSKIELYTEEEAREILEKDFYKYLELLRKKGVQIVENNVKIEKNGFRMQLNAELTVIEEIGVHQNG